MKLGLASCAWIALTAIAQDLPGVRVRTAAWFPPGSAMSSETNLIELVATVRDRKGRSIAGLRAEDFEVLDNNQPRRLSVFEEQKSEKAPSAGDRLADAHLDSTVNSAGRLIALFFDDVHASAQGVRQSAAAAERLIEDSSTGDDRIGIFTSSGKDWVDFSSDRRRLLDTFGRLTSHPQSGVHATTGCPALSATDAYIIAQRLDLDIENSAVEEAVACNCTDRAHASACAMQQREVVRSRAQDAWQQYEYQSTSTLDPLLLAMRHLAGSRGERIFIIMSPGFPAGGLEQRTSAIVDTALRANIRVSGLNSEGLVTGRLAGRKLFLLSGLMADTAKSTGGRYLHDTNDLTGGLRVLTARPEASYLLGFLIVERDNKYHSLKVRVHGERAYIVESRPGYYAGTNEDSRETIQQRIDRLAVSDVEVKDFPVVLQVRQDSKDGEHNALYVTAVMNVDAIPFAKVGGRDVQELTFVTVLQDAGGSFVVGRQSVMDMELTSEGMEVLRKKGDLRAVTSFTALPRGSYRVREVVREVVNNRMWASRMPAEIH
jgi:VWFA-related protein